MRRYILGSAHSENKFVQKKNRQLPAHIIICVDILMRCAVNSIFDCAGVLATPYN